MGIIADDDIKLFMSNEEDAAFIKKLSGKYALKDFVKVDLDVKEYLRNKQLASKDTIYGCIVDCKNDTLFLNIDSVDQRLIKEYFDFLLDIIKMYGDASVQYILAYHYIAFLQQLAFQLSVKPNALFEVCGESLTPVGEHNYDKYIEATFGDYHEFMPYIRKEDILKYSKVFYSYGHNHHAAKHFSLIEYFLQSERIYGSYELNNEFEKMIDSFVYRYKAVFTYEKVFVYMTEETRNRIMDSLVEL